MEVTQPLKRSLNRPKMVTGKNLVHTYFNSFSIFFTSSGSCAVVSLLHRRCHHIWGMIFWWFVMKSWWASVALDVSLVFNTLKASGGIEASNETVNCGERPGVLSWNLFLYSSFTSRNACFPTGLYVVSILFLIHFANRRYKEKQVSTWDRQGVLRRMCVVG